MTSTDVWLLLTAAACVVLAGGFSAADAALATFSRARAQELVAEGKAGARRRSRSSTTLRATSTPPC